jgi:hypothetical protein
MGQRRLGDRLRALILAAPLIAVPACGPHFGPCPDGQTDIYPIGSPTNATGCQAACITLAAADWTYYGKFVVDSCSYLPLPDGGGAGVSCTTSPLCPGGRRPASLLIASHHQASHALGTYFAEAARLEAASIPAFHVLATELRAHLAPAHLVDAALRSAQDEVRHTRATAALARRYGAAPVRPAFGPTPMERSLEAIATENAIEGCVRETYGALVALWQGRHAQDPVVAAAMEPIAADETRHAELAWEVAAWVEPRLSRASRGRVEAARAQALAELASEATRPVHPLLVALAGLPAIQEAMGLLSCLEAEVRISPT